MIAAFNQLLAAVTELRAIAERAQDSAGCCMVR